MRCTATAGKGKAVLATTSSFASGAPGLLETIRARGLTVILNPFRRKLQEAELRDMLAEHHPAGLLAGTEPITRPVLEQARDYLKVISRVGAGWDNVDHDAATDLNIRVYRTEGVLTQAVAELTLGLMLAGLRAIALQDRMLRQGQWQKLMGGLLQGTLVGIIGFGAIGKRVGELVRAFGAEVIYCDVQDREVPWAQRVTLAEALTQADIITLHASGKKRILGAEEFKSLGKRGILLINTARGELIDEEALCACLAEGGVGRACLDVFCEEPYGGPLRSQNHVILTPHIGSYAREARQLMEETAVANLLRGLREADII
jgi:D-3-phosphoglycerate dehydrogenase